MTTQQPTWLLKLVAAMEPPSPKDITWRGKHEALRGEWYTMQFVYTPIGHTRTYWVHRRAGGYLVIFPIWSHKPYNTLRSSIANLSDFAHVVKTALTQYRKEQRRAK